MTNMMMVVNTSGFFLLLMNMILISMSTASVLIQWVCLEVSMLCVIPMLINFSLNKGVKLAVKYFISQNPASILLIISMLCMNKLPICAPLFMISIMFKLGLPPFQGWVLNILCSVNFWSLFLLLSIQKFIPLILLSEVGLSSPAMSLSLIIYVGMITMLMGMINSAYYLLFLSSILNVYWMLGVLSTSTVWVDFMLLYCSMSASFIVILHSSGSVMLSDFSMASSFTKLLMIVTLLNMSGIPPLTGFLMKLMILKAMASSLYFYTVLLLITSVLMMYIYLMISYQLNSFKGHHVKSNSVCNVKSSVGIISITLLPLLPFALLV